MHSERIRIVITINLFGRLLSIFFFFYVLYLHFNEKNYLINSQSFILSFNHINIFVKSINQQINFK
jgi:hypothetical protein